MGVSGIRFVRLRSEWLDHAEGASTRYMVRQVKAYLRDRGMTGLASAWPMARRRPKEYRREVDAATRCSDVCPIPDLT